MFEPPLTPCLSLSLSLSLTQIKDVYELTQCLSGALTDLSPSSASYISWLEFSSNLEALLIAFCKYCESNISWDAKITIWSRKRIRNNKLTVVRLQKCMKRATGGHHALIAWWNSYLGISHFFCIYCHVITYFVVYSLDISWFMPCACRGAR